MNNNYLVPVAGNGLLAPEGLGRRALLTGLSAVALALPAAALASASGRPSWMQQSGEGVRS